MVLFLQLVVYHDAHVVVRLLFCRLLLTKEGRRYLFLAQKVKRVRILLLMVSA